MTYEFLKQIIDEETNFSDNLIAQNCILQQQIHELNQKIYILEQEMHKRSVIDSQIRTEVEQLRIENYHYA
jgi:hypothetical protein